MKPTCNDSEIHQRIRARRNVLWTNPEVNHTDDPGMPVGIDVPDAQRRMERAIPLLGQLFPDAMATPRAITSPLLEAGALARALGESPTEHGRWLVKADHLLPVAGSIKARGGFHEIIAVAERLATDHGLLAPGGDLRVLGTEAARELFAHHSVVVGSTGNLGMAIGLVSAALGFRAVVHMSSDARQWKKQRLVDAGVTVVEHSGDYLNAVAQGRAEALGDPFSHFVDDEYSVDLFNGYAVAAAELKTQLDQQSIPVDRDHPLFVHLPCGVGGAPGGIAYGLKELFGDDVHCFFAEPVGAPCMLVQLESGSQASVPISDFGLDGRTEADGLAVGRASMLVAPLMRTRVSGVYTVTDEQLFVLLRHAVEAQEVQIEPSAAAAMAGPLILNRSRTGRQYLSDHGLMGLGAETTHVIWTTGGSLVPDEQRAAYLDRAVSAQDDLAFKEL